jgi:hypothetical protein
MSCYYLWNSLKNKKVDIVFPKTNDRDFIFNKIDITYRNLPAFLTQNGIGNKLNWFCSKFGYANREPEILLLDEIAYTKKEFNSAEIEIPEKSKVIVFSSTPENNKEWDKYYIENDYFLIDLNQI